MNRNLVIGGMVAVVIIVAGTMYLSNKAPAMPEATPIVMATPEINQASPLPSPSPKPPMITKGMKFSDSPLSKNAYQIAPGGLTAAAKKALAGFSVESQKQSDGSLLVKLVAKTAEDQNQQYTVKPGEKLYFVELNPGDDKVETDEDLNLRDDFGVLVDQNGMIL